MWRSRALRENWWVTTAQLIACLMHRTKAMMSPDRQNVKMLDDSAQKADANNGTAEEWKGKQ